MYLYVYEDGTTWQLSSPPTDVDFEIIAAGSLSVFILKLAGFQRVVGPDKTEPVKDGKISVDELSGQPYSAWADEEP